MKAFILAAGYGTRLRPFTEHLPKCMIPVAGKPILEHTVERLRCFGITDLVINLCYLPTVVMNHFGDGRKWGVKITYSIEPYALGTAGGVKNVAYLFDGPFLVWYGDNLSNCDIEHLCAFHKAAGSLATIALYSREDPTSSGIVGLDENNRITRFLEKPRPDQVFSHWVNAGIYVLEKAVLDAIPVEGTPDFGRHIFPSLLNSGGGLFGYRLAGDEGLWWIDTPQDLQRVQKLFSGVGSSRRRQ